MVLFEKEKNYSEKRKIEFVIITVNTVSFLNIWFLTKVWLDSCFTNTIAIKEIFMKRITFLFLLILSIVASSFAQLYRYQPYGYLNSFPSGLYVYGDSLYFTARNPSQATRDLWCMDGNALHQRVFANTAGMSLYFTVIGGKGDSLIMLLYSYPAIPHMEGVFACDLKNDSLHLLIEQQDLTQTATNGVVMNDGNNVYYTGKTSTGAVMYRYNIAKGKLETFCELPGNMRSITMIHCQKRYYISLETIVGSGTTSDIYKVDTINKKLEANPITSNISTQYCSPMVDFYGDLYFFGEEAIHGRELYKYTGNGVPVRMTDVNTNSAINGGSSIDLSSKLAVYNNKIYFSGSDGTLINDGSLFEFNVGLMTTRLIYSNSQEFGGFYPSDYYVYHNRLYMSGCYGAATPPNAVVYNGSQAPLLIRRLNLSDPQGLAYTHKEWTSFKGYLYFFSNDTFQTVSLYKFDDTILGPAPLTVATVATSLQVKVYPNPVLTDAYMNIALQDAQKLSLQLLDMEGRVLYAKDPEAYAAGNHIIMLPMKGMPGGTYVYRLSNERGQMLYSGRVIRQ